ncbi:hypothetical protein BgiMline_017420 [Biomphalaria glabrata]
METLLSPAIMKLLVLLLCLSVVLNIEQVVTAPGPRSETDDAAKREEVLSNVPKIVSKRRFFYKPGSLSLGP